LGVADARAADGAALLASAIGNVVMARSPGFYFVTVSQRVAHAGSA